MANANARKINDDDESPEATEAALAAGSGAPEAAPAVKEPEKGKYTSDRGYVDESTSLPLDEKATESMTAKEAARGLKGVKADEVLAYAVRVDADGGKRLVVVTADGQKCAKPLD